MDILTTSVEFTCKKPPLLPDQWSSSYISYWQPMQQEDQITSGICWFDYEKNCCRIDGLFNPWSESKTGHHLWMSEIITARDKKTKKSKVAYYRKQAQTGTEYEAVVLKDDESNCDELILTQDILFKYQSKFLGNVHLLGKEADVWSFIKPGKGLSTYYFAKNTNQLIRMVTGDPKIHASVRDFPNFNTSVISDDIFKFFHEKVDL
ncbi:violacein biosynthesis enzyme VioE [Pigmentibacter ruber]|uniref:violacein biosynthesis enzyme VioE n=1 Tax=Pigmentibacter ruber TaxID=2683196 RepID=UPI00131E385E|nr:violacein biosynthesis enzyme VioE [Pigmentibacter ruber]